MCANETFEKINIYKDKINLEKIRNHLKCLGI